MTDQPQVPVRADKVLADADLINRIARGDDVEADDVTRLLVGWRDDSRST